MWELLDWLHNVKESLEQNEIEAALAALEWIEHKLGVGGGSK